jgi:hypothetical protein
MAVIDFVHLGFDDQPATCRHRCNCECHILPEGTVHHVMACCTGCGKGHTQIQPMLLQVHLRECHRQESQAA